MPDKPVTVTVNSGRVLHVHPDLADGHLAGPPAEEVAETGVETAAAQAARAGDRVRLTAALADRLAAAGVVTRT